MRLGAVTAVYTASKVSLLVWSAMLRVLTLSTRCPNASQATLGVFVERQTLALAGLDDVALEVVSPIGLPPWPLSLQSHYAPHALLPLREEWKEIGRAHV